MKEIECGGCAPPVIVDEDDGPFPVKDFHIDIDPEKLRRIKEAVANHFARERSKKK